MTQKQLREEVVGVLVNYLNDEKDKRGNRLFDGDVWEASDITDDVEFKHLGLDSLDMVELLMVFEDNLLEGDLYLDEKIFRTVPTFGSAFKEIEKYVKRIESEKDKKEKGQPKKKKPSSNKKQTSKPRRPRKKTGPTGENK